MIYEHSAKIMDEIKYMFYDKRFTRIFFSIQERK